jgi:hypothetical protein
LNTSLTAAGVDRDGQLWLASQPGDLLLSRDDGASFSPVPQSARGPVTALATDTGNGLVLVASGACATRPVTPRCTHNKRRP